MLTAAYITEMEVLLRMYQFGDGIAERYFGDRSILRNMPSHETFADHIAKKYLSPNNVDLQLRNQVITGDLVLPPRGKIIGEIPFDREQAGYLPKDDSLLEDKKSGIHVHDKKPHPYRKD
ncbi:hypothetical protein HYS49_01040 [Candidatus Woesearchaeota archaeon]|nr:hypothetical protein [Candidatus Woesearchaeota archaeon]